MSPSLKVIWRTLPAYGERKAGPCISVTLVDMTRGSKATKQAAEQNTVCESRIGRDQSRSAQDVTLIRIAGSLCWDIIASTKGP